MWWVTVNQRIGHVVSSPKEEEAALTVLEAEVSW